MRPYVLIGRFQPFHNGHAALVRTTLESVLPDDGYLMIGVIGPSIGAETSLDARLTGRALAHHVVERNPFAASARLRAIVAWLDGENVSGNRAIASLVPRPDHYLDLVRGWFERDPVMIVPDSDDDFDNEKVRFFEDRQLVVVRVAQPRLVSGEEIRRSLAGGDLGALDRLCPRSVAAVLHREFSR